MVGRSWKQVLAHGVPQHAVSGTHGTFHFIVDHALVLQFTVFIVGVRKFEAMPFLAEKSQGIGNFFHEFYGSSVEIRRGSAIPFAHVLIAHLYPVDSFYSQIGDDLNIFPEPVLCPPCFGGGKIISEIMGQTRHSHGREGQLGRRPDNEIGYHALRVGDNAGEHTIVFGLLGETIELRVEATNRDCYALGALAAAKFVASKPPSLYRMYDVLGL